ncbi:hypothetical protein OH491_14445 [Termitidicoccus mucosus]|uniref:Uncharacterized protein n=1 Tax=Termitidicoccus mucosus TaxID=1184151 RepID=A0A178IAD8_9BACT|nr:hypothetical protein AW736_25160 [Opitutaceae bacterium TSB47]
MNKTLLLIICDFLLLNLLALTRWEEAIPADPQPTAAQLSATTPEGSAPASKDDDLVSLMKMSLEDERAQREQTLAQLQATEQQLQQREQNLSRLEADRAKLSVSLSETQQSAADLAQRYELAARDANVSKERLAQLQRDLEQTQTEAERRRQEVEKLAQEQAAAREKIENLNVAVKVAEQEKVILRQTAETLKEQVQAEREERVKALETTTQLAQGVGQLAEKSTALTQEIRDNRPINANTLFSEFLANRVQASFTLYRSSLLGGITRDRDPQTVLVRDGENIYAILHVDDTPFTFREANPDWTRVRAAFVKDGARTPVAAINFLSLDPRLVTLPVTEQEAAALGAKIYETALDPFKFPEAVLISNGGKGYAELPFKLDPTQPGYVKMDKPFFSSLRGDLVISKTGELLGIMVNSSYCVVINNFLPAHTLRTGDDMADQKTSVTLNALTARVRALPMKLQ